MLTERGVESGYRRILSCAKARDDKLVLLRRACEGFKDVES